MRTRLTQVLLALLAVGTAGLLLVACGPGGGGTVASGGIGGTGRIAAFGSVFVNGIEYFIDGNTAITMDGIRKLDDSELGVGMVVTVKGQRDASGRAVATEVSYSDAMQGPVTANVVDPNTGFNTLTVLGQTIKTDRNTVFAPGTSSLTAIANIDPAAQTFVEVSGYPTQGAILATRIAVKALQTFELKGVVTNVDTAMQTFEIGNLIVNYSGPLVVQKGWYVEVQGSSFDSAGALNATQVQLTDSPFESGGAGAEVEFEGVISDAFNPANNTFSLNDRPVTISVATLFENGGKENLLAGALVQVDGQVAADGSTIVAAKIEFRTRSDDDSSSVYSVETTIDSVGSGTLSLFGGKLVVHTDSTTLLVDEAGDSYTPTATDPNLNFVEVELFENQGQWMASRVTPVTNEGEELSGILNGNLATGFSVLGVPVDLSKLSPPPASGDTVDLKGTFDGSTFIASPSAP